MQTAVVYSVVFSRTEKNQHNVYPQRLVFGFKYHTKFSVENCLYIAKIPEFVLKVFYTKFGLSFNFTQNFSATILKKYDAKKYKKKHLRKFGKYIVYNVSAACFQWR